MNNILEDDNNGLTKWIYFVGLLIFASFSPLLEMGMFFSYL